MSVLPAAEFYVYGVVFIDGLFDHLSQDLCGRPLPALDGLA